MGGRDGGRSKVHLSNTPRPSVGRRLCLGKVVARLYTRLVPSKLCFQQPGIQREDVGTAFALSYSCSWRYKLRGV